MHDQPQTDAQSPFPAPIPQPAPRERDLLGKEPPGDHIDWSHRKGEPRVFAVLWMIYLLCATALMFSSISSGYSVSPSVSRPASQQMLVMVGIGIGILWPMVRFSQTIAPPSVVGASIRDMVVVMIPIQAVLWPQRLIVLGGWSADVVIALVLHFLAWGLVIAGMISIGSILISRSSSHLRMRMLVMVVTIFACIAAPLIEVFILKGAKLDATGANLGWMLSPITGILEITTDRSVLGQNAMVYKDHFRMILAVSCVGLAFLIFARALETTKRVAH